MNLFIVENNSMSCSQSPGSQLRYGKKEMKNLRSNMKSQLLALNSFWASYTNAKT
jgi:hypothetical protein